jgi:hypothetical protein
MNSPHRKGHDLLPLAALGAVVLPLEGHGVAIKRDEAAFGDGDAMGVARQIHSQLKPDAPAVWIW